MYQTRAQLPSTASTPPGNETAPARIDIHTDRQTEIQTGPQTDRPTDLHTETRR